MRAVTMRNVIAAFVEDELARRGWTGSRLASEAGVSETALSEYTRSVKGMSLETWDKIVAALGLDEAAALRIMAAHAERLSPRGSYTSTGTSTMRVESAPARRRPGRRPKPR